MRLGFPALTLWLAASCTLIDEQDAIDRAASFDGDGDGVLAIELGGDDCDDTDPMVFPGADEICNGRDDDCSGETDEGTLVLQYADADGDGFGDAQSLLEACPGAAGYVDDSTDCNDASAAVHPDADELDCDGIDNDCDGTVDVESPVQYVDSDGDGFGDPTNPVDSCSAGDDAVDNAGDCDDGDASIKPGATEFCDGDDNDCNGQVDDDAADERTWYADTDQDGIGDDDTVEMACLPPAGSWVEFPGDCDDTRDDVYPDAEELCDLVDNDCNGTADDSTPRWWPDVDGDGYGDEELPPIEQCDAPGSDWVSRAGDCDDTDASANPDLLWFEDADDDGFGNAFTSQASCEQPAGFAAVDTDCDDDDSTVNPGEDELCDAVDRDCDGDGRLNAVDKANWYADVDSDGHGDPNDVEVACLQPTDFVATDTDCDDGDATVYGGAPIACDGVDHDCDGLVDEDADQDTWENALCGGLDCDDTDDGVYPGTGCAHGTDCLDILNSGLSTGDGTYSIDPEGIDVGEDPLDVRCDMSEDGGGWTCLLDQDFENGLVDSRWSHTVIKNCPGWNPTPYTLGGASETGKDVPLEITLDALGIAHSDVWVTWDYYSYDSWDNEWAFFYIDGVEHWTRKYNKGDGSNKCFRSEKDRRSLNLTRTRSHSADSITLLWDTDLDEATANESFGLDNVHICIR